MFINKHTATPFSSHGKEPSKINRNLKISEIPLKKRERRNVRNNIDISRLRYCKSRPELNSS